MVRLSYERYYSAIEADTAVLAELVLNADPQLPVPTCPGWTLGKLVSHVGRTQRWACTIVATRSAERVGAAEIEDAHAPSEAVGRSAWLIAGAAKLVESIRAAGTQTPVWSWADEQTAGFWARRIAHETLVHQADAAIAVDTAFQAAPDLAADGICELFGFISSPKARQLRPHFAELRGDGQTLHFHATDDGLGKAGEWLVRRTPEGVAVEHGHGKGDVAVRGAAADLLLLVSRRIPAGDPRIEVFGDHDLLGHWLAHTAF